MKTQLNQWKIKPKNINITTKTYLLKKVLLVITIFTVSHYSYSQKGTFKSNITKENREHALVTDLINDIRRAVYQSEKELSDCLPPFKQATITLEGSYEKDSGGSISIFFISIGKKRKKSRTNKVVMTFTKDQSIKELLSLSAFENSRSNASLLKNMIISAVIANCNDSRLSSEVYYEKDSVIFKNYGIEGIPNDPVEIKSALIEKFKTDKLEIEISFIVEDNNEIEAEFEITPVSGKLNRKMTRKNIQTINLIFGKDPE